MIQENQSIEAGKESEKLENVQNSSSMKNGEAAKNLSLSELFDRFEAIINEKEVSLFEKEYNSLKKKISQIMEAEKEIQKQNHLQEGKDLESFSWQHQWAGKFSGFSAIFKEKLDKQHQENKAKKIEIIERLKNLYTNSGENLFKGIRSIKEDWLNSGFVAAADFKHLNNDYYHHLDQFYKVLDLNKEYLEQEYAHNLEKRNQIISRAKELEKEQNIQKVLNELQYLHKLWKDEAEPVAEEFRETTWQEFKEISNKIHDRKQEFSLIIEKEQNENLELKNQIIDQIKSIVEQGKNAGHTFWQGNIEKVEKLRESFLRLGGVPKKESSKTWTAFKQILKDFNYAKNTFYKTMKDNQGENLQRKLNLIAIAKENMNSQDWDTVVPLFKKLQQDWREIGHVPRSQADKIWNEFREYCNVFFDNFREKNNIKVDNWKENYKAKKEILNQLKQVGNEQGSVEKIKKIEEDWNLIGKVPKDKIGINKEFNKVLKEKQKLNNILSAEKTTDKARKIKNQIEELSAQVVTLENNLGFFSDASRENPLLVETYKNIDAKKEQIIKLKEELKEIINSVES